MTRNKKKTNRIIAFLGPNGAGKSTQMDLLVSDLERKNIPYRKTWIASHHLFVWFLGVLLAKLGYPQDHWTKVNPDLQPSVNFSFLVKGSGIRVTVSKIILITLELINLVIADLIKVRIPRLLGYCVIIEKYFPVTLADLTFIFNSGFLNSFLARMIISLIPKDAQCIFLDADYEALLKRRGDKTEAKSYLDLQCSISRWYAKNYPCLVINTSEISIQKTHQQIITYLNL